MSASLNNLNERLLVILGLTPDSAKIVMERIGGLERELADCRRTCAELVTDGNAVTLAQTVQRLSADKARLDSGLIRIGGCIHKEVDLRDAIDRAIAYESGE